MTLSGYEKNGIELKIHESIDELSSDLAEYIAELSEASIKERGIFTFALSGGSLINLMQKLCESPYSQTIDWRKWFIFWTDERVVSKSHNDSNYKLAKEGFLSKVPIIRNHVRSMNDKVSARQAAKDYEYKIRQFVQTRVINVSKINDCPKFDLILLGMGPDGHVASLFPNHPTLHEKEQWVTFLTDSPEAPPERISFTLPVINSASNVVLVVTGSSKADVTHLAIDDMGSHVPELPARMVRPVEGKLVWFLDMAAASKLEDAKLLEERY